jgi:acyl-coenzyme A thioesterase 13
MSASAPEDPLAAVNAAWQRKKPDSPIYAFLLDQVSFVSATSGTIVAQLPLGKNHVNSKGGLHGAVSATLVDWAGGMAIASTGAEKSGVSTDIHISYLNPAKVGDTLTIEGKVSKHGRSLAYTTVEVRRGDGAIVCSGLHTKFVG